jgi:uncharacterized protein YndB with AHSA1/START domain
MSKKYKYQIQTEIHADVKRVWQYISTPAYLQEWFADQVVPIDEKTVDMIWDNTSHIAKISSKRTNSHIKFTFLNEGENKNEDAAYVEIRLDYSEMTQSSFLSITDYSEMDSKSDLDDLWSKLLGQLKEVIGASFE